MPRAAHGARQQAVGRGVIDKTLNLRVPFELAFEQDRYVADLAQRIALHRRFYGADGFASALYAVQEIPYMIIALVKVNLGWIWDWRRYSPA